MNYDPGYPGDHR